MSALPIKENRIAFVQELGLKRLAAASQLDGTLYANDDIDRIGIVRVK